MRGAETRERPNPRELRQIAEGSREAHMAARGAEAKRKQKENDEEKIAKARRKERQAGFEKQRLAEVANKMQEAETYPQTSEKSVRIVKGVPIVRETLIERPTPVVPGESELQSGSTEGVPEAIETPEQGRGFWAWVGDKIGFGRRRSNDYRS